METKVEELNKDDVTELDDSFRTIREEIANVKRSRRSAEIGELEGRSSVSSNKKIRLTTSMKRCDNVSTLIHLMIKKTKRSGQSYQNTLLTKQLVSKKLTPVQLAFVYYHIYNVNAANILGE